MTTPPFHVVFISEAPAPFPRSADTLESSEPACASAENWRSRLARAGRLSAIEVTANSGLLSAVCSTPRARKPLGRNAKQTGRDLWVVIAFQGSVDRRTGDGEYLGEVSGGVLVGAVLAHEFALLLAESFGCSPQSLPLARATTIPSRVRMRSRSTSNSVKVARMLKNIWPMRSRRSGRRLPVPEKAHDRDRPMRKGRWCRLPG